MNCQLDHIHLVCRDIAPTIEFFTENFGAEFVCKKRFGKADGAMLDLGGTTINLRLALANEKLAAHTTEKPLGYHHIGIRVEDIEAMHRSLVGKGFSFPTPPTDIQGYRIAFVEGPENLIVEMMEATD
jgi:catechol 2,3-dioxygenase-like lactoylglutathione lyase family enzyme